MPELCAHSSSWEPRGENRQHLPMRNTNKASRTETRVIVLSTSAEKNTLRTRHRLHSARMALRPRPINVSGRLHVSEYLEFCRKVSARTKRKVGKSAKIWQTYTYTYNISFKGGVLATSIKKANISASSLAMFQLFGTKKMEIIAEKNSKKIQVVLLCVV